MSDAKLKLQSVGIVLDSKVILDDVNLKIDTGEIVSLMGSSASGKTSLIPVQFLQIEDLIYRSTFFIIPLERIITGIRQIIIKISPGTPIEDKFSASANS